MEIHGYLFTFIYMCVLSPVYAYIEIEFKITRGK